MHFDISQLFDAATKRWFLLSYFWINETVVKDGASLPSWKQTLFWFLRWNSSPTTSVDFTRCFLPSHLWNHSREEEEEQQVWRSHFTPFSVRASAAIKLWWPTRLCFSRFFSFFPAKATETETPTNSPSQTDLEPFQFFPEGKTRFCYHGFPHPSNDWPV